MNCYKIEYQHKPPAYVFAESFAGAEEVSDNQFAIHQIKSIKVLGPALMPPMEDNYDETSGGEE